MATWPSTLPQPLLSGYGVEPVDQTLRTDMEVGSPRVRRRTSVRNDQIPVSWLFDATQFSAFRTWFDGDAAGGAAWFTVALPLGDADSTEARFTEAWRAEKLSATHWRVTGKLEVR